MNQNRKLMVWIVLLVVAGFLLLMYPLLSSQWNQWRNNQLIAHTIQQVSTMSQEDYDRYLEAADAYNRTLLPKDVPAAFSDNSTEADQAYLSQLAYSPEGIMGYIKIPLLSVTLPIYHTTSDAVLETGVGHLQGSSLPVGGESTHCVLSAHRGLPSSMLFTDLDQLQIGDHFYIYVLDRSMAYEVDQIKEVEPTQTEDLAIQPGKDLVTLVTCTPYGVNTHRLLVRGHRVPYVEDDVQDESHHAIGALHTRYGMWAAGGLLVTVCFVFVLFLFSKKASNVSKKSIKRQP